MVSSFSKTGNFFGTLRKICSTVTQDTSVVPVFLGSAPRILSQVRAFVLQFDRRVVTLEEQEGSFLLFTQADD